MQYAIRIVHLIVGQNRRCFDGKAFPYAYKREYGYIEMHAYNEGGTAVLLTHCIQPETFLSRCGYAETSPEDIQVYVPSKVFLFRLSMHLVRR